MKRWPLHKAWFWETAPFFRVLAPLVAGILVYSFIPVVTARHVWIHAAMIIIIISVVLYGITVLLKKSNTFIAVTGFLLVNIIIFLSGWSLCYLNDVRNDKSWFGRSVGSDRCYVARITEQPAEKETTRKLFISVNKRINGNMVFSTTGKAFVYVYKDSVKFDLHAGDTILLPNKWLPIKNSGNPYEFDYARYCARNNLFYQQFISADDIALYSKGSTRDVTIIERSHNWCMRQIDTYIHDTVARGLIQAMLIGDEVNLDPDLLQAYSETGIVHIIAISGANVGIFFCVVSWLLWWLRHKKHEWIKYAIALPLVWFYVIVAGAQPSALRAAAMFSLYGVGLMMQKNKNNLNQLSAAAAILLLAQPMWLFSVGFQLSFVALLSLILFYPAIYKLYAPPNLLLKMLWETIAASMAAEILVAPLVVYYFHLFPVLFLISNVIAFIFMGLATIAAILIVVLSFIPVVAKGIAVVTVWLVTVFDKIVYMLRRLNPDSFRYLQLSFIELFLLYGAIGGVTFFLLRQHKHGIYAGLIFACLLVSSLCSDQWIALHQQRLVVYNIPRTSHVELIRGKFYTVVHTDTGIGANKKIYTLKPAHTRWHAWRGDSTRVGDALLIVDTRILLLNKPARYSGTFPVDHVIVEYAATAEDVQELDRVFSPRKIILGNNPANKQTWQTLRAVGPHPAVYVVTDSGACVIDGQ